MKINDGTNWQDAKSLKIHNGTSWQTAKKAYVYNNGWQLAYPNLPTTSGVVLLYSGTTYPTVGTVWSIQGNWNTDPAYAPVSFTYQWKRNSVNISGATSSTYTAVEADLDKSLTVTIVATNLRGNTTVTAGPTSVHLPTVSSMTVVDNTATPSQPSVSISYSGLSYSGSWTSSSNATTYNVSTNNGSVTTSGQTFSGSGTNGSVTVTVTPVNTDKKAYIYWTAAPGAASYNVVKYGNNVETVINVPSSQLNYTWSIVDGNEGNYFSVYPKSAAGTQGYGIQRSLTVSNKTGSSGSASTSIGCTAGYVNPNAWVYGGATYSGNCVGGTESGTYSWRYNLYRYADCTEENIMEYGSWPTSRACTPTCTAGWEAGSSYTYADVTWSGNCSAQGVEGGSSPYRTRPWVNADCTVTTRTELGPFYQTRSCTPCVCNYTDGGQRQSYHYAPECCPGGSTRAGSLSGVTTNDCCPNVSKTTTKWECKSYDVTNSASSNYSTCYSVDQCAANYNSDGSRTQCWL